MNRDLRNAFGAFFLRFFPTASLPAKSTTPTCTAATPLDSDETCQHHGTLMTDTLQIQPLALPALPLRGSGIGGRGDEDHNQKIVFNRTACLLRLEGSFGLRRGLHEEIEGEVVKRRCPSCLLMISTCHKSKLQAAGCEERSGCQ